MTRRVASYIILTADGMPELGPNASVLEGAVVDLVRAMRAGDGPPIGLGAGADLFATLNDAGLIEDYGSWSSRPRSARVRRCSPPCRRRCASI